MIAAKYWRILLPMALAVILGCSSGGVDPVEPDSPLCVIEMSCNETAGHSLAGMWDIHFDLDKLTAAITPIRGPQAHYNITPMLMPPACNNCIKIVVNSFDPVSRILDADVTIYNPTELTAYDVRGILFTNQYGHELRNADDWTPLWDIPGGLQINPFKAFAKDDNRRSDPHDSHTEKYLIYMAMPPHFFDITYAVDVSFPNRCPEPYEIDDFWSDAVFDQVGSHATAWVDVLVHHHKVTEVALSLPAITGEEISFLEKQGGGHDWTIEITNNTGAPAGDYTGLIRAKSEDGGDLCLYDFVTVTIHESEPPLEVIDVTPPWLNAIYMGVYATDTHAFASDFDGGLHIFDITDPESPTWKNYLPLGNYAREPVMAGSCLYVPIGQDGVAIVDVSNPESPFVVDDIDTPGTALMVIVKDTYLIVADGDAGLQIIDITDPGSAAIVGSLQFPGGCSRIESDSDTALVRSDDTLFILDISNPTAPEITGSFALEDNLEFYDFDISGGYAYLTANKTHYEFGLFRAYDIDPPNTPTKITELELPYYLYDIKVAGERAYIGGWPYMYSIDISIPDSPTMISTLEAWLIESTTPGS